MLAAERLEQCAEEQGNPTRCTDVYLGNDDEAMLMRRNRIVQFSDSTSRLEAETVGRGGLEYYDDATTNNNMSAIGEPRDVHLSLFKTENGANLFAKQLNATQLGILNS